MQITRALLILFALGWWTPVIAADTGFSNGFRLAQLSVLQRDGNSFSGMLTYNPRYAGSTFGLSLELGGTVLKSSLGTQSRFVALSGKAMLDFSFLQSYRLEAGGGAQFWVNNGDLLPCAGGNLVRKFDKNLFGFVNHLFAGYNAVFVPKNLTHEILVGFGIVF